MVYTTLFRSATWLQGTAVEVHVVLTQKLQCSSFLVMTFCLRDYNLVHEKELPLSPWVYGH